MGPHPRIGVEGGEVRPIQKERGFYSCLPVLTVLLRAGFSVCTKFKDSPEASSLPSSIWLPAS